MSSASKPSPLVPPQPPSLTSPEEGASGACLLLLCSQTRGQFIPAHPFPHLPRVCQGLGHTQLSSAHRPSDNISNLLLGTVISVDFSLHFEMQLGGNHHPHFTDEEAESWESAVPLNRVGTRPVSCVSLECICTCACMCAHMGMWCVSSM